MASQNSKTDNPDGQLSQCWVLLLAKNSQEVRTLRRNGHVVLAQLPFADDSLLVRFEANGESWRSKPAVVWAVEDVNQARIRAATAQQARGEVGNSSAVAAQEASGEIANDTVVALEARVDISNGTVMAAAEEVRDVTDGGSVPTTEASEETRDGRTESEEAREGETHDGDAEKQTRDEIGAGDCVAQEARDEKSDEAAAKETSDVAAAREDRGNGPAQDMPAEDAGQSTGCLMGGLIFATEMCSSCTIM